MGRGKLRNEQCWCSSGRKFKNCHQKLQDEERVSPWEAESLAKSAFRAEYCSVPDVMRADCSSEIVRAHTIPRSASLGAISRDGHVYMIVPSMKNFIKGDGRLEPQLVGVKRASTFTGFCGVHDCSVFAPLENQAFAPSNREQLFLLGYRAFARERFTKRAAFKSLDAQRLALKGRDIVEQARIQTMIDGQEAGIEAALADQEATRSLMDRMLLERDFEDVRAYVIELAAPPSVMCSGSFCPEQDFRGTVLQDLGDWSRTAEPIHVSVFAELERGYAVLSWLATHDHTCRPLAESLDEINDAGISSALLRLMLEFFENVCISPDWWESLDEPQRRALVDRMMPIASPLRQSNEHCLVDDGLRPCSWGIRSRMWIG